MQNQKSQNNVQSAIVALGKAVRRHQASNALFEQLVAEVGKHEQIHCESHVIASWYHIAVRNHSVLCIWANLDLDSEDPLGHIVALVLIYSQRGKMHWQRSRIKRLAYQFYMKKMKGVA